MVGASAPHIVTLCFVVFLPLSNKQEEEEEGEVPLRQMIHFNREEAVVGIRTMLYGGVVSDSSREVSIIQSNDFVEFVKQLFKNMLGQEVAR